MPYSNKQMLRDANGDLIPQYWDVAEQEFKPLTGRDGANDVRLTGSNVEDGILTKDVNGRVRKETITYQRAGVLAGNGASETLYDEPEVECELQSFSLGTDYQYMQIRISFYKDDGTLDGHLMIARSDGSSLTHPNPRVIHDDSEGENDFWALRKYDRENNEYVVVMKRPLHSLNGLKITIHNWGEEEQNIAVNAAISKWGRIE